METLAGTQPAINKHPGCSRKAGLPHFFFLSKWNLQHLLPRTFVSKALSSPRHPVRPPCGHSGILPTAAGSQGEPHGASLLKERNGYLPSVTCLCLDTGLHSTPSEERAGSPFRLLPGSPSVSNGGGSLVSAGSPGHRGQRGPGIRTSLTPLDPQTLSGLPSPQTG